MKATRLFKLKNWAMPAAALLLASPGLLRAQDGVVAGTVVAQGSQRPLGGVEVGVVGTPGRGTFTDA